MSIKDNISLLIKNELDKEELYLKVGIASQVDAVAKTFTLNPIDDSAPIAAVRMKTVETSTGGSFIIIPAEGSLVAAAFLDGVSAICLTVEVAQSIIVSAEESITVDSQAITFNGGANGGLINIDPLTSKLNELVSSVNSLVSAFNSHAHTGVTTGGGTSGPPTAVGSNASNFNASDYLDDVVTH